MAMIATPSASTSMVTRITDGDAMAGRPVAAEREREGERERAQAETEWWKIGRYSWCERPTREDDWRLHISFFIIKLGTNDRDIHI
jgi:hypothetical protein